MKCQFYFLSYVDDILVVCRCMERIFVVFNFISECFFKYSWQRETQVSFFFLEIIAYEQYNFYQQTSEMLWRSWF